MLDKVPQQDDKMASYATQIKELGKKYGKVAIGVHLSIYLATLTGAVVIYLQQ